MSSTKASGFKSPRTHEAIEVSLLWILAFSACDCLRLLIFQAPKDSRAVDEGSVLCLVSRHGLGRVEEVFGPVEEPLYTLRYAGGGEMPAEVVAGAPVFSVERFSTYVLPEAVKVFANPTPPLKERTCTSSKLLVGFPK